MMEMESGIEYGDRYGHSYTGIEKDRKKRTLEDQNGKKPKESRLESVFAFGVAEG